MGQTNSVYLSPEQVQNLKDRYGEETTDDVRKEAAAIFKKLDVSSDGKISKEEFSASLGMMGTNNSILHNLIFDAIDSDQNGDIDFLEFVEFLLTVSSGTIDDKLKFGFRLIDLDKNGTITKIEIITFIKTLIQVLTSFELTAPELEGYVEELTGIWEFNEDNEISWERYRDGCLAHENFIKNLGALQSTVLQKPKRKIGKKVFLGQEKWDFMIAVMFSLQVAIEKYPFSTETELIEDDYSATAEYELPTQKKVSIVTYSPKVFWKLRQYFGITDQDFVSSVGIRQVLGSFLMGDLGGLSELVSEGKSGSFFYYSSDLRFLVKTIGKGEQKSLLRQLKNYEQHLKVNPNTLLTRICGLYQMKIEDLTVRFIVMANLFPPSTVIQTRYDLKGSTIGRSALPSSSSSSLFKDLDFIRKGEKIRVGEKYSQLLVEQIEKDSLYLEANGIIDYSLLIGINEENTDKKSRRQTWWKRNDKTDKNLETLQKEALFLNTKTVVGGSFFQSDEGGMYSIKEEPNGTKKRTVVFIGIIDILIEYETFKQGEHFFKSLVYDGSKLSVVPPQEYGPRFRNFMKSIVEFPTSVPENENEKEKEIQEEEEKKDIEKEEIKESNENNKEEEKDDEVEEEPQGEAKAKKETTEETKEEAKEETKEEIQEEAKENKEENE